MHMWEYGEKHIEYSTPNDGVSQPFTDVPAHLDILPDGTLTEITGNPEGEASFNHQQGDNPYGYQEDCGLVSAQDILNQFGIPVSEGDVVQHAIQNGECSISTDDPSMSGGTSGDQQMQILSDYGIPAHMETQGTLESLASHIQDGQRVIISVNAGYVWNDPNAVENGQANHAVVVTGVAQDPTTGQIQGFYVNDSGNGKAAEFIDTKTMEEAWVNTGGASVVTDAAPQ